jgi:hypothetical protein
LTGATVLGLSSAPLLCLGMQGGMIVWNAVTKRLPKRAWITFAIVAALYTVAAIASTRGPIAVIATGMTLDPWTGFYRLQIWENGMNNVWTYPITGLGLADWDRPAWMFSSTVDAFWLVIMMRMGIPAFLMLVIAITMLVRGVNKRTMKGLKGTRTGMTTMARAWMMSLIAISLVATTVHLWNVTHAYFFFFLGVAGMFADPKKIKEKVKSKVVASKTEPPRVTPFPAYPGPGPAPHPALPAHGYPLPNGAYGY